MSSVEVNDENRGAPSLGEKHSDMNEDIFVVGNPTGRPSILRQTENLPSNTVPKGVKVCFQTPRRDPVTKRIVSPTKTFKMTSVDECTKALESLNLEKTDLLNRDAADQTVPTPEDEMPLPSRGEYQLNFENTDAINPFQSSNKIALSPVPPATETPPPFSSKGSQSLAKTELSLDDTLPFSTYVENSLNKSVDISSTESSVVTVSILSKNPAEDEQEADADVLDPKPFEVQEKAIEESPMPVKGSYNFDFDNLDAVNPFQTGGSKIPNSPACNYSASEKQTPAVEQVNTTELGLGQETVTQPEAQPEAKPVAAVAPISANTNLLTELNFNPFGSKATICNSPKGNVKTSPESVKSTQEKEDEPGQKDAVSLECISESQPVNQPSPKEDLTVKAVPEESVPPQAEHTSFSEQKSQGSLLEEEFVSGATFMANDFEGQIDYLEQFGSSSFKESALRKQSLYLKFDPLLKDSPKKGSGPAAAAPVSRPAALISRFDTQLSKKEMNELQKDDFKLLDVATEPCAPVLSAQLLPILPVSQAINAEDAIIEVLKYSQKDMDAALSRAKAEAEEQEKRWIVKNNKLLDDGQEMRKVVAEFELVIAKMLADQEKEREVAQAKLKEALMEKDQVSSDLNSLERSFSDLFKRLEKYKTVIEGYKKNEETLKTFAQDSLARIKVEEQRYQTLKAHAEDKMNQANKEIAVLHAQLGRDQLKLVSLEKTLDQKEKEVEELTKICDDLIGKVQKG